MRIYRVVVQRIRSLFGRARVEADLQREMEIHIDALTREFVADGVGESEARILRVTRIRVRGGHKGKLPPQNYRADGRNGSFSGPLSGLHVLHESIRRERCRPNLPPGPS